MRTRNSFHLWQVWTRFATTSHQQQAPRRRSWLARVLDAASLELQRVQLGLPEKSQMLFGMRRVAKNLLMELYATLAEGLGCCELINSEAQEVQSLASNLVLVLISFGRSLGDLLPSCSSRHSGATAAESHCC